MYKSLLVLFFTCCFGNFFAQETAVYTNPYASFLKATALFKDHQFLASKFIFTEVKETTLSTEIKAECAYYIANCAIRLNEQNAEQLVEQFVADYPMSLRQNEMYLNIANYYFENAKYAYANKWYQKVNSDNLSSATQEQYNFNRGYTAFVAKDFKPAIQFFTKAENSKVYGSEAKYYLGYIAYQNENLEAATSYFDAVGSQEKYKEKLSYYQADLHFKLGKFEKAIALAKEQIPKSTAEEVSQLNKIIGESYFNLKKYAEAIPYLEKYNGKNGKWKNEDYYQLGYSFYTQNKFKKAIAWFNKIIDGKNTVAQNAYYHLGACYLKADENQQALHAFKNASEMQFDKTIQEDAWLNYVKLSYKMGNPYEPTSEVISNFLKKYPKSEAKKELESLLIDSYISTKNYDTALQLLKNKRSETDKKIYQKVAFYKGVELLEAKNYTQAISFFDIAIHENIDNFYVARAWYWKAECYYYLNNFPEALKAYQQFSTLPEAAITTEAKTINYAIAYTYYKQKKYAAAIPYFQKFILTTNNQTKKNDAYLRLADAYFVTRSYANAITNYNYVIQAKTKDEAYAAFQVALSEGYLGKSNQKIEKLEAFISKYPNSNLQDDALFNLANACVTENKKHKAEQIYNQLLLQYPTSVFVPRVLLRQGLVLYGNSKNEKALEKFKKVVADYPGTPEANQAVATARLIYIDLGDANAYANWVNTLNFVDVSNVELDETAYQTAEKKYVDNKPAEAINLLKDYLKKFPKGIHVLQAHFYLAQLYFANNQKESAIPHYRFVVATPKNEFSEEALVQLSSIYLDSKNWDLAIPILIQLEQQSDRAATILYAQSNLMQLYYQQEAYEKAKQQAELIVENKFVEPNLKNDAKLYIARSAVQLHQYKTARNMYTAIRTTAVGEIAAESIYYEAYFKNKEGNLKISNQELQQLIEAYSAYTQYCGKGLLIMADNYNKLNDAFQANYILESVIKNFSNYPEIATKAEQQLQAIKEEQAKTNSSVAP